MILTFGRAEIQTSIRGDQVSTTKAHFGSQPEQIVYLRKMVDTFRGHHGMRTLARDIVFRQYGVRPKEQLEQALAIGDWVQRNITYVNELPETFQTPPTTVSMGYGDCEDYTVLICTLLEAIGIPSELVGMEWGGEGASRLSAVLDHKHRRQFQHIFPRAVLRGGAKVPLDATLSNPIRDVTDPLRLALERGARVRTFVQ